MAMLSICAAIEAFIEGWVYSRRMEREITVSKFDSITHLHFGDTTSLRQRFDEFMIFETPPAEVIQRVAQTISNLPHLLTVFTTQVEETREAYAHHAHHLHSREYLMAKELDGDRLSPSQGEITVQQVGSEAERQWFNQAHDREVIPARALNDPRIGYYFVRFGAELGCEGRCIVTADRIAVADSIYTADPYRRRGLGSALMQKMLFDAARQGASHTVLAASEEGHKLYLTLGYAVLADMLVFEAD